MITQSELKYFLDYNEETGIFTWLQFASSKATPNSIAGTIRNDGYISISINKKPYLAHRLAWLYVHGEFPENIIDHINGNPSDNKISNLRSCTMQENMYNRKLHSNNKSGVKGVYWNPVRNNWRAEIKVNKVKKTIGSFKDLESAKIAIKQARLKYHGDFANNN